MPSMGAEGQELEASRVSGEGVGGGKWPTTDPMLAAIPIMLPAGALHTPHLWTSSEKKCALWQSNGTSEESAGEISF